MRNEVRLPLVQEFLDYKKYTRKDSPKTYLKQALQSIPDAFDLICFSVASKKKSIAYEYIKKAVVGLSGSQKSTLCEFRKYIETNECDHKLAKDSLMNCGINIISDVKNNMKVRLRGQSRLSGDKTWLPLDFICRLYSHKCKNCKEENEYLKWINDIYERIYIIIDDNGVPKHVLIKDIGYIGMCSNGNVYGLYNGNWNRIMTPTGYLNKKEYMYATEGKSFSIDHVTPIDKSLQSIQFAELERLSNFVKEIKDPKMSNRELEKKAFEAWIKHNKRIDFTKLTQELEKLRKDSHYVIMQSKENGGKSNFMSYTNYYYDNKQQCYIAKIGECKVNGNEGIIYQILDNKTTDVLCCEERQFLNSYSNLKEIKGVDVPIDFL